MFTSVMADHWMDVVPPALVIKTFTTPADLAAWRPDVNVYSDYAMHLDLRFVPNDFTSLVQFVLDRSKTEHKPSHHDSQYVDGDNKLSVLSEARPRCEC